MRPRIAPLIFLFLFASSTLTLCFIATPANRAFTLAASKFDPPISLPSDEPLSVKFKRAVIFQRSGDNASALREYEIFLQAAESCDAPPEACAEAQANAGAACLKMGDFKNARKYLELALEVRDDLGTANVNLALVAMAEAGRENDAIAGESKLRNAEFHCRVVLDAADKEGRGTPVERETMKAAQCLLDDVESILQKMGKVEFL